MQYTFQQYQESADYLRGRIGKDAMIVKSANR